VRYRTATAIPMDTTVTHGSGAIYDAQRVLPFGAHDVRTDC
jgi:hypothetical protein